MPFFSTLAATQYFLNNFINSTNIPVFLAKGNGGSIYPVEKRTAAESMVMLSDKTASLLQQAEAFTHSLYVSGIAHFHQAEVPAWYRATSSVTADAPLSIAL